jgi:hypothetical protein
LNQDLENLTRLGIGANLIHGVNPSIPDAILGYEDFRLRYGRLCRWKVDNMEVLGDDSQNSILQFS